MDDVNNLVITPFREVSEKATEALNNAGENQDMRKAAQKLVKEGDRSLKRLEPLCTKLHNDYGDNFLNALKENTEIANFRSQLNELLWDFDDYTEEDDFDAEKYAELQALSRQAAPRVYDILISMKLEAPIRKTPITELSPPSSPLPPPSCPIPPIPSSQSTRSSQSGQYPSVAPRQFQSVDHATGELANFHDRQLNGGLHADGSRSPLPRQGASPAQPPPRPPSANPWDHTNSTLLDDEDAHVEAGFTRRPTVAPLVTSSPRQTAASPTSAGHENNYFVVRRPVRSPNSPVPGISDRHRNERDEWQQLPTPPYSRQPIRSPSTQHRPSVAHSPHQQFPEEPEQYGRAITTQGQDVPGQFRRIRAESQALSIGSNSSAIDDQGREDMVSPEMVATRPRATSMAESFVDPYLNVRASDHSQQSSGRGANPPITPTQPIDSGLILVEHTAPPVYAPPKLSQQDCSISSNSSFYTCKGFCDGAKDVIIGGIGVKKTRKPVGFTGQATVARCMSCLYELNFQDIENDVSKLDVGNFSKNHIGYRLRFLQKSHVPAKRVDDILYGCVFCVHMGRTIDASDSTVFFSTKALFNHLARHPRPLPEVPGIVVVDQAEIPPELHNDYDLHFKQPPVEHPVLEHEEEISTLPTAYTREPTRRMYGQRLLGDKTPALEMVTGAHVTGLTWPAKYMGEWAFGWHDGIYASVPTDAIKLEPPPVREIKLGGTSNVRAKAQWKFSHKDSGKDKTNWLKFDKNDVITNISWPYPEHWCWSGTNSKGKWGIFPQAFIDTNTVQELSAAGSDRASNLSNEKNKSSHIIPRFSIRKTQGPPSIASSRS